MAVLGEGVVVAVGAVGRVAAVAPHELDRLAVDRHEQRAVGAPEWAQVLVGLQHVRQVDADGVHAGLLQQRVEPRRVGALRQPQPAAPAVAEAPAVSVDAGAQLEAHAGIGREQRQDRVGRR